MSNLPHCYHSYNDYAKKGFTSESAAAPEQIDMVLKIDVACCKSEMDVDLRPFCDFVLVYRGNDVNAEHIRCRELYKSKLKTYGLRFNEVLLEDSVFVEVYGGDFDVLCAIAEKMGLQMTISSVS